MKPVLLAKERVQTVHVTSLVSKALARERMDFYHLILQT